MLSTMTLTDEKKRLTGARRSHVDKAVHESAIGIRRDRRKAVFLFVLFAAERLSAYPPRRLESRLRAVGVVEVTRRLDRPGAPQDASRDLARRFAAAGAPVKVARHMVSKRQILRTCFAERVRKS
jgi:hypothetical protein